MTSTTQTRRSAGHCEPHSLRPTVTPQPPARVLPNSAGLSLDPRQKISPDQMARVFEQLDLGIPIKALAVDLGVCHSTLCRRIAEAERLGFAAFMHPSARK